MRLLDLDCRRLTDKKTAHACLKEALSLPDYYGGNLDALYDCLTEGGEYTILRLTHTGCLEEDLGDYGARLLSALQKAAEDNPNLRLLCW